MKTIISPAKTRGMTMVEVVAVIFSLALLIAVVVPAFIPRRGCSLRFDCTNNLKQIGLAFRIWEGDNNDKYPMAIAVTNGGAMEAIAHGDVLRVFEVMSNELSAPRILVCPEDKFSQMATNFALTAKNVSYFINPNAIEAHPQDFMTGDDNFEINGHPVKSGFIEISSNTPIAWSKRRHKYTGNIGMADGSCQSVNNSGLSSWHTSTNFTPVRLVIP